MHAIATLAAAMVGLTQLPEPAPRALTALPLPSLSVELADVAGVRELPDGRILLSDARGPAIWVIDPSSGTARQLGREGQGPNEYARPGGIYPDTGGGSFVLDRAQPRVLVVDRHGMLTGMRSVEVRGFSSSSDGTDPRRVDGALYSYFIDTRGSFPARGAGAFDSLSLVRFDAARQQSDTVAMLARTKPTVVSTRGRMTLSRTPVFSPADGWGVAPDGSVAVVRATPYRVDWLGRDGRASTGGAIAFVPVPVTAADREAREQGNALSVSGGSRTAGGRTAGISSTGLAPEYAKTKPAFDPETIIVAPDGRVWVGRYMPANAKQTVYDVFDRRGARVDRVAFPPRSRVVGFGATTVYVAELDEDDVPRLGRYR
jgi:hypothetical protein